MRIANKADCSKIETAMLQSTRKSHLLGINLRFPSELSESHKDR